LTSGFHPENLIRGEQINIPTLSRQYRARQGWGTLIGVTLKTDTLRQSTLVLPEARAFEGLAEVGAFHFHDTAHFVKPGAHALADAVAESLSARCPLRTGKV